MVYSLQTFFLTSQSFVHPGYQKKDIQAWKVQGTNCIHQPSPLWLILLEEMRRHLGFTKLCKQRDKLPINWCRSSAINSSRSVLYYVSLANRHFTTSSVRPQDCLISKLMNFDQFLVSWKRTHIFQKGKQNTVFTWWDKWKITIF